MPLAFVHVNYDGTDLKKIIDTLPGSGHPTVHPKPKTEKSLVRIKVANPYTKVSGDLRADPHPAWASNFRHVVFNGFVNGTRRIFIADLGAFVSCIYSIG